MNPKVAIIFWLYIVKQNDRTCSQKEYIDETGVYRTVASEINVPRNIPPVTQRIFSRL